MVFELAISKLTHCLLLTPNYQAKIRDNSDIGKPRGGGGGGAGYSGGGPAIDQGGGGGGMCAAAL